jgi:type II secretory pathway component PulK
MMSMLTTGQRTRIQGAAIMLALWALFLLSALVIAWALDINSRLAISGEGTRMLKAEAVACSGAEVAFHPSTKPGSPNLNGQLDDGATYHARLTGEGGRIDLNWVAIPEHVDILRRYLENKGIDLNERDTMIDSLLDWVQPGTGLHRLNAPDESDDYHPAHAALRRVDELKKVAGWAEFTSVPGWDDDFTVNMMLSGDGRIDVNWASRDVLLALPGMTNEMVERFIQIRQGPDQIDGTEDDVQFKSLADFLSAIGLNPQNPQQVQALQSLITTNSLVYRVVSVGTAGKATRTVQMVFRRMGLSPQLLTWKEF